MTAASETESGGAVPAIAAPPWWGNRCAFALVWVFVWLLTRLLFRVRVENPPRLRGGYVLAPNHGSFLDPLVLGTALRRRVVFLMTEVIWRAPAMHWFYRLSRSIPVAVRGGNREALRAARAVLQQGRIIGIFPEGGISRDGGLLLGNPGAVSMVLAADVPIVPVAILGSFAAMPPGRWLPRPVRITVRFGAPILPQELAAGAPEGRKARLQFATRLIMERIAALAGATTREAELERARAASTTT